MKKKIMVFAFMLVCSAFVLDTEKTSVLATESEIVIKNDETGIPDKILYKGILEELHKEADDTFTVKEAETIEWLHICEGRGGKNSVAGLKGIGCLKNLRNLDLEGNSLTSLEGVDELAKLEMLTVDSGLLKDMKGIGTMPALEYFSAYHTELTDLKGIEKFENLKWLIVDNNHITSLSGVENLKKLEVLSVSGNDIIGLEEIKDLKQLISLDISACGLKQLIDLRGFTRLGVSDSSLESNYFSKKELYAKLPEQLLYGSESDTDREKRWKKEWLQNQIVFQCQNYKIRINSPTKITQYTTKITGKVYGNAKVVLYDGKKRIKSAKADKAGKFRLKHLNLKKWKGKTLELKVSLKDGYGEYVTLKKGVKVKVRK